MNLAAAMIEQLVREPQHTALVVLAADGSVADTRTRSDLLRAAASWRDRFNRAGLTRGDRIAIAAARDADLPCLHLAALSAGLAIVPINTASSVAECERLLEAADVRLVVASRVFTESHREAAQGLELEWWVSNVGAVSECADGGGDANEHTRPESSETGSGDRAGAPQTAGGDRQENARQGAARLAPVACENETALVLYTSGTTGKPKSVAHTHEALHANLAALATAWQRDERDRLLHVLPAHHFHGLVLALYGSLLAGNTIVVMPRFEARAALDAIHVHEINLIMGVPTMYARMLAEARPGEQLGELRLAVAGSAPLGAELWQRFRDRFGIALVERYGLTETAIVASNPIDAPRAGSVGKALDGMTIAIRTDDGRLLEDASARGVRGEICVRGPSVMQGYGNDPEATRAAFDGPFFRTGDLGRFDADGYLWIDGRLKELIIVGGSNVVPGEVERALTAVAGVEELVVAGAPDADLGEIVACYFVLSAGAARELVESELRAAAERGLAAYKCPRKYVCLPELPRNAMGKVDRAKLAAA